MQCIQKLCNKIVASRVPIIVSSCHSTENANSVFTNNVLDAMAASMIRSIPTPDHGSLACLAAAKPNHLMHNNSCSCRVNP